MKPQPDTRVVFRCQSVSLEKLIAGLGEVLEEEVITVPDYQETKPVVPVPNYRAMRPVVAVEKRGEAPGEFLFSSYCCYRL